jgi:putative hydroxymethylpyrimidine transport system permease protein
MKLSFRIIVIFFGLLLIWQAITQFFSLPAYILPTPAEVFKTGVAHSGLILSEAIPTFFEALAGLFLGTLFACAAALGMAFYRPVKNWFFPILIISQALPTFAIAPLLVIWLGYGMASKIITTMIMLFFPITSAFYDGLRRTELGWLDLAKTMRAKKWRVFLYIRIPAALPALASGLRVAAAIAPIGAIVGEWIGASHGLGYLMLNANARMQIDLMFAALFTIIIFSLTLYFIIDALLRAALPWQPES